MNDTPIAFWYRSVQDDDLAAILHIQAENYPREMQESPDVIAKRITAARDTSLVTLNSHGVCAYLFAYHSLLGRVTPLDGKFSIASKPDSLYLHDLAVSRQSTGLGIGRTLVNVAFELAKMRGISHSALIAVQRSSSFWTHLGFRVYIGLDADSELMVRTYPGNPCYMVKALLS
ncbi:GNAT family N-acetyltransferase [Herbaspirillum sp. GCM10030257]|uniref:GNAT family N-acetyltransferase n=1 Tax=Herbaspirillum sp. GCM10030257 TaxID=3273393 RepID=UPI003610A442